MTRNLNEKHEQKLLTQKQCWRKSSKLEDLPGLVDLLRLNDLARIDDLQRLDDLPRLDALHDLSIYVRQVSTVNHNRTGKFRLPKCVGAGFGAGNGLEERG